MYLNDLIVLDRIIDEEKRKINGYEDNGSFFEFFATQQILKNYDLTKEEIENGIADGGDDGGIDAIYMFVNGILINDINDLPYIKTGLSLELYIFTSKYDSKFKQVPLNNELSTLIEFFDLSKMEEDFNCIYNEDILDKRKAFYECYLQCAPKIKNTSIKYYYVSRGDSSLVAKNIKAKSEQIIEETHKLISSCSCEYIFYGATELLNQYREQIVFDLSLPCSQILSADDRKYIVLCKLKDYFNFITDENKGLKRYLFDSNVRDFNGFNKTNEQILLTLSSINDNVDFWWLNNGITILSSNANNVGSSLRIENVQIVNGLQTSYSIYDYYKNNEISNDDRKIMIKVITETNNDIRDRIIRATNSQSPIQEENLHATDKIQRDIEKMLSSHGMYYERRANFYKNQGVDYNSILTPLYISTGYFALIEKRIEKAVTIKQKFMTNRNEYEHVFVQTNFNCWPRIGKILKRAEHYVESKTEIELINSPKKIKILRSIVSLLATSLFFKTFNYSENDIATLPMDKIDEFEFERIITFVFNKHPKFDKQLWKKDDFVYKLLQEASEELHINNLYDLAKSQTKVVDNWKDYKEIYEKIKPLIPNQPWPKMLHRTLANSAGISQTEAYGALTYGIKTGDYYLQKCGLLFDKDGKIVSQQKK